MLAGSCHPRFFIEETEETMRTQMDQTYVLFWTVWVENVNSYTGTGCKLGLPLKLPSVWSVINRKGRSYFTRRTLATSL